jgi:hypothetical protein
MRSTIFCNHYRAMSDHETCKAGVSYSMFKGMPFEQRPCFCHPPQSPNAGCSLMEMPTPEQLAEEEADIERRCEMMGKARRAIVEHLGGPWKRGTPGASGRIDCPACGDAQSLSFSRAGYNGHIHARCKTPDCVNWME